MPKTLWLSAACVCLLALAVCNSTASGAAEEPLTRLLATMNPGQWKRLNVRTGAGQPINAIAMHRRELRRYGCRRCTGRWIRSRLRRVRPL